MRSFKKVVSLLPEEHKPYLTNHLREYAVPGWPSWLGRETHRVNAKTRLRHLEVAGSNPVPGTLLLVKLESR